MAASIVVSIPVVAGFLLMQRFLVAGLTAGAVK
jgi:multiple sugar transport system permease protein